MGNQSDVGLILDTDLITPNQYFIFVKGIVAIRVFICVGGIVGNSINVRTFLRIGLEDSVTITFFALAISDLMFLISVFATTIDTLCESFERDFNIVFLLRAFYIKLVLLVFGRPFNYITTLLTVFLAIQRCLCVAMPLQFKGVITRVRTSVIIFIIWAYGLACAGMILSHYEFRQEFVSAINSSQIVMIRKPALRYILAFVNIANGTVLSFSSQILVLICVIIMVFVLKKSVKFRQMSSVLGNIEKDSSKVSVDEIKTNEDKSSKIKMNSSKERQVIVQVSLVSTIFLIASSPYTMIAIAGFIVPALGVYKAYHYTYSVLYDIKVTLEIVNSAVNVFIYYKYNTKFRQVCFRRKIK